MRQDLWLIPSVMADTLYSATAEELLKEYKACESPDYISYVSRAYLSGERSANSVVCRVEKEVEGVIITVFTTPHFPFAHCIALLSSRWFSWSHFSLVW